MKLRKDREWNDWEYLGCLMDHHGEITTVECGERYSKGQVYAKGTLIGILVESSGFLAKGEIGVYGNCLLKKVPGATFKKGDPVYTEDKAREVSNDSSKVLLGEATHDSDDSEEYVRVFLDHRDCLKDHPFGGKDRD